jgi:hypothetical protein
LHKEAVINNLKEYTMKKMLVIGAVVLFSVDIAEAIKGGKVGEGGRVDLESQIDQATTQAALDVVKKSLVTFKQNPEFHDYSWFITSLFQKAKAKGVSSVDFNKALGMRAPTPLKDLPKTANFDPVAVQNAIAGIRQASDALRLELNKFPAESPSIYQALREEMYRILGPIILP